MTKFPKRNISRIESLPHELVTAVLSRVAASSLADLSAIKLSSKKLKEFAEDAYVYKHARLHKFPIVSWFPSSADKQIFANKCRKSANPELIYREALVDFFQKTKLRSAYENLSKALKLGHTPALYVKAIILIFSGINEWKQEGIQLIGRMKKSKILKSKVGVYRKKLIDDLTKIFMWGDNPIFGEKPICCTTHQRKIPRWLVEEDEDEECDACGADTEVRMICSSYQ